MQCFQIIGIETLVIRGQSKTVQECLALRPRYVVLGPGPGTPSQASLSGELIAACAKKIPLLGICLGHQALGEVYGGVIKRAGMPMHGKTSAIFHHGKGLFRGIPQGFSATRYHSLVVEEKTLPSCLEITARSEDGEIMGLRHRFLAQASVQFHPESILTEHGLSLLINFLDNSL